jgi:hypothetical protein
MSGYVICGKLFVILWGFLCVMGGNPIGTDNDWGNYKREERSEKNRKPISGQILQFLLESQHYFCLPFSFYYEVPFSAPNTFPTLQIAQPM